MKLKALSNSMQVSSVRELTQYEDIVYPYYNFKFSYLEYNVLVYIPFCIHIEEFNV